MTEGNRLLVVSAHAADFVWRCGGTMASYIDRGAEVHLVVLSYGVRGESGELWKVSGQTEENVKRARDKEVRVAAEHLGVSNLEIWDFQDYHMTIDDERMQRLVRKMREVRPNVIVSHPEFDILNPDHNTVCKYVFEASVLATSIGVRMENLPNIPQPQLFGFEPHQTEISRYQPDLIVDITDAYEKKLRAMQCFQAQPHLIEYYSDRAKMRGNHARRVSGNKQIQYAETFSRYYPTVSQELI